MTIAPNIQATTTNRTSTGVPGFVERYANWTDEQSDRAAVLAGRMDAGEFDMIRVSFVDPHGFPRTKWLAPQVFSSALRSGLDYSLAPFIQDTGQDIAVDLFARGVGHDLPEFEGSSDFVAVPDPLTFRSLPWAPRTGWVLADEFFKTGSRLPLSPRNALRQQVQRLERRGQTYVVGLEIEFYLTRLVRNELSFGDVGGFGTPGTAPTVQPVDLGYQFNGDDHLDQIADFLMPLCGTLVDLGLPLRSAEHESGPGQIEITFEPLEGLAGADAVILFKAAVRQFARRNGFHASFMCKPALQGCDPSGWHLHQSIADSQTGHNLFMSDVPGQLVSQLAENFAGGLIANAAASSLFTTPTINGYQRYSESHTLAPTLAGWADDNRGAMIRVLGAPHDPSPDFSGIIAGDGV
ncbi:hypothetical protein BTO20_00335 [Mycobacterium dioxanotrophicus]|uniref:GS catalytic domain-containing protein n=1 Tax=Mycobacterium dioxanotrophicus TaxID=482462 RepID=A0A1Y0BWJ7_9MYCO|nr:glutamine synthetase family protein [Mycobacterium dioxanotrophicus]ART67274.1 hypothetical protein BTO20_00335 [Mycobacterium dioxanotrophicus]